MAPPNLAVRSDSWLDLSRFADSRQPPRRNQETGSTRNCLENYSPGKRHSIGAACCLKSDLLKGQSTGEPCQQQHLLIRVRQRSYFHSRCSSSGSLSSHLSQSIELNASESHLSHPAEPTRFSLLKRQPLKLATLRKSLRRAPSNSKHRQSPLARSLSSLSELVSSKLSHLTSSWKHLLYEFNRDPNQITPDTGVGHKFSELHPASSQSKHGLSPEQVDEITRSEPLSALHRRQLTDHWVRHHQLRCRQQASMEPSLRDRSRDLKLSSHLATNQNRFTRAKSLDTCSLSSSASSAPSSLVQVFAASSKQSRWSELEQLVASGEQCRRKDRSDTRSSSTLVSRSSCSTSTLHSQLPLYSNNHQTTSTQKTTMTQPTSDYWSSSTTNTDYGAHGARRLQQVPQLARLAPALDPDADYYYQVAELERQRCPDMSLLDEEEEDVADFEDYAEPADESCLLDRSQVELVQMIGEGQKGYVFLGKLQSRDGRLVQDVAIKTLKYETDHLIEKLMREAQLMRQLEHPHIIRFIGVCPDTPALIAMELAELGEIKQYLKLNEHIIPSHLVLFTFQISTALSYLESRQCVHRDVAARNVLVCSHDCVKLADFDLSRDLQPSFTGNEQKLDTGLVMSAASPTFGHYVSTAQGKLPIRWLAPESLTMRRFTSASDVWMFAVCAWELFHYGSMRPWHNIRNNQVLTAIQSGQRLARPPTCPERLYQLMLRCWAYSPDDRPRFKDIKLNLWSIYLKERARVQLDIEQHQQMLHQSRVHHAAPECSIHDQAKFRQQATASPQRLRYSYSSNASGYSSNNPIEHSNNSSRSSTMGSMMRQKPLVSGIATGQPHDPQVDTRFRKIPGHMLERQRSHGSIITHDEAISKERLTCRTRDDLMLPQVLKKHQPRPLSEMYTDTRNLKEERLVGLAPSPVQTTQAAKLRAKSRPSSRPSSTCCTTVPEQSLLRETVYDGVSHEESIGSRGPSTRLYINNNPNVMPHQQQANSSTYPQDQSAKETVKHLRKPNASLTPNSLEEQHQLALHQRLLGHIKQPRSEIQHQHHRRSVNVNAQGQQATSGLAATEQVDQSLEILESLIAGRNFSKRSAVVKNISNLNQRVDRNLMGNRKSRH